MTLKMIMGFSTYFSKLIKGYYKIVDTINNCTTKDHIDTTTNMFHYYQIISHKNLINLRKYAIKHILLCPVQTIRDYYSYEYMYKHLVEIIEKKIDVVCKDVKGTKKTASLGYL